MSRRPWQDATCDKRVTNSEAPAQLSKHLRRHSVTAPVHAVHIVHEVHPVFRGRGGGRRTRTTSAPAAPHPNFSAQTAQNTGKSPKLLKRFPAPLLFPSPPPPPNKARP